MQEFCISYEGIICERSNGRTYIIYWITNQAFNKWYIYQSNQIYKRIDIEIWTWKGKSFWNSYEFITCLEIDAAGKDLDEKMYRGMVGSLLYLTVSHPKIMFSVCKCTRFQSTPKESHLTAVKQIIRYLIGTSDMGLWYLFF